MKPMMEHNSFEK